MDDRSLTPSPFPSPLSKARAATLAEKKAVLDTVLEAWSDAKDLRLGQLLCIALQGQNLFMVEDLDLLAKVGEFRERVVK